MIDTATLVKHAAARFKHSESNLLLQEKYTAKLVIPYAGGMWRITTELLAFLRTSTDEIVIMVDIYNNPFSVDTKKFLELTETTYKSVMQDWHDEYIALSKNR